MSTPTMDDMFAHLRDPEGSPYEECPRCNGYGSSLEEEGPTCSKCAGTGLVVAKDDGLGELLLDHGFVYRGAGRDDRLDLAKYEAWLRPQTDDAPRIRVRVYDDEAWEGWWLEVVDGDKIERLDGSTRQELDAFLTDFIADRGEGLTT